MIPKKFRLCAGVSGEGNSNCMEGFPAEICWCEYSRGFEKCDFSFAPFVYACVCKFLGILGSYSPFWSEIFANFPFVVCESYSVWVVGARGKGRLFAIMRSEFSLSLSHSLFVWLSLIHVLKRLSSSRKLRAQRRVVISGRTHFEAAAAANYVLLELISWIRYLWE